MTKLAVIGDDIHLDAGAADITQLRSGETAVLILVFAAAVTRLVMMREGAPSIFFCALEQIMAWMVRLRAP